MIIVKVPLRIPFFSGGSDSRQFYGDGKDNFGLALSATINKYVYVGLHQLAPTESSRFAFEDVESSDSGPTQMKHLITAESFKEHIIRGQWSVSSVADITMRGTGLGSSSAYAVGINHALYTFKGEVFATYDLAQKACTVEIDRCKYPIGKQDQFAAAYGGMNLFRFQSQDKEQHEVTVQQYHNSEVLKKLRSSLMLINTTQTRHVKNVLPDSYNTTMLKYMAESRDLATEAWEALHKFDVDKIGELFNRSWIKKKLVNRGVSNDTIDELYDTCIDAGAVGGKILGAGGGGFMLLYVKEENRDKVLKCLSYPVKVVPFEFVHEGSRVVYNDNVIS